MELYTLNENFQRQHVIDHFSSVVWTERYGKAGDVLLAVSPTREMISRLPEGTLLQIDGSKEVMLLETSLIEDGQLKVTGNTLDQFLNERLFRGAADVATRELTITDKPGEIMSYMVFILCISLVPPSGGELGIDRTLQIIPNLSLGTYDSTGPEVAISIPFGPLYNILEQIAQTYSLGFSLYLDSVTENDYSLKFKTYAGLDRTSEQEVNELVRFSQNLDSLTDLKEIRSIAGYKTVCYAFPSSDLSTDANPAGLFTVPGVAYVDDNAITATGFDRRAMMITVDTLTPESVANEAELVAILTQRAKDALANNTYIRFIDGEVTAQSQYKFGQHYNLGDIVELQSATGILQRARITEYIRTQDATGERSYPTVSVLD